MKLHFKISILNNYRFQDLWTNWCMVSFMENTTFPLNVDKRRWSSMAVDDRWRLQDKVIKLQININKRCSSTICNFPWVVKCQICNCCTIWLQKQHRRFSTIIFSRASANVEVYSCFSKTSTDRRRSTDVSIITKNINFITEKFDALRRLCDIGGHFSPLAMVVNYNRRYVDDLVTFLIFM